MKQCGSCGFAYEGEICPKCIADFARNSTPAAPVGDLLPGFEQFEKLGRGGMGTVYKAKQVSLDRWVAVKILSPELAADEDYVRRFLIEARTAGKLRHENLVSALDCGRHEGRYFMVMEFVEGRTLEECAPLPEDEALDIVRQVADGLQYAWERHVIHRDIKPQNIMLTKTGAAKLCDLGLCRDVRSDSRLTATGRIHCTPAYASPEQARGEKDLDTRTDIYSLGITLYELLTGERPFSGEAAGDLLIKQATEKPVPPIRRNPRISAAADQLVLWMIEKSRDRRPANPAVVAARIREILQPAARVAAARRRVPASPHRSSTPWIFLGAFAVVLFVGLIIFLSNRPDPPTPSIPEPRRAETSARRERERPPVASQDHKQVEKIVEVKPEPKKEEAPVPKAKDEAAEKQARVDEALGRVKAHVEAREWTKARGALDDALAVKPSDPTAWEWKEKIAAAEREEQYAAAMRRAETYLTDKDWDGARVATDEALKLKPNDPPALEIQKKADLERAFKRALAEAELTFTAKDWNRAVSAAEKALKVKPGESRARALLGKAKELVTRDPSYFAHLRTLSGHTGPVVTAAFTRGGSVILSGGEDNLIKAWDVKSGKDLLTLNGHGDSVWQVRASADGKVVVSASKDSTFRIWDTMAGKQIDSVRTSLDGTTPLELYAIALSPDGRTVVAAGSYPAFFVFDPVSKEECSFKVNHTDAISALCFGPTGKIVASTSWDQTIKLWEPGRPFKLLNTLRGHSDCVRSLAFSPDGRRLASASFDRTVALWEVASGKQVRTFTGHADKVTSVAFSPDGKMIASGSFDTTIRLWDVATGEELRSLVGHTKTVREVCFSPDGKVLASTSADGTIRLWSRPRK